MGTMETNSRGSRECAGPASLHIGRHNGVPQVEPVKVIQTAPPCMHNLKETDLNYDTKRNRNVETQVSASYIEQTKVSNQGGVKHLSGIDSAFNQMLGANYVESVRAGKHKNPAGKQGFKNREVKRSKEASRSSSVSFDEASKKVNQNLDSKASLLSSKFSGDISVSTDEYENVSTVTNPEPKAPKEVKSLRP